MRTAAAPCRAAQRHGWCKGEKGSRTSHSLLLQRCYLSIRSMAMSSFRPPTWFQQATRIGHDSTAYRIDGVDSSSIRRRRSPFGNCNQSSCMRGLWRWKRQPLMAFPDVGTIGVRQRRVSQRLRFLSRGWPGPACNYFFHENGGSSENTPILGQEPHSRKVHRYTTEWLDRRHALASLCRITKLAFTAECCQEIDSVR